MGALLSIWDVGDGGKPAKARLWAGVCCLAQRRGATGCTAQASLQGCSTGRSRLHTAGVSEECATYQEVTDGPGKPSSEKYDIGNHSLWSCFVDPDRFGVHTCSSQ